MAHQYRKRFWIQVLILLSQPRGQIMPHPSPVFSDLATALDVMDLLSNPLIQNHFN